MELVQGRQSPVSQTTPLPMSTPQENEAYQSQSVSGPDPQEAVALFAALPWILKHYYVDSIELLETEGRLARRSLAIVAVLTLCLAATITAGWLAAVALAAYLALAAGVPFWAVAAVVILLHIILVAVLAQKLKSLSRYLLFPHSRRALVELIHSVPATGNSELP